VPGVSERQFEHHLGVRDDDGQFFLNGNAIGAISGFNPPAAAVAALNTNANGKFRIGRNCLRARVVDTRGGGTSLRVAGNITGTAANCP
jgi:hypothetical protein